MFSVLTEDDTSKKRKDLIDQLVDKFVLENQLDEGDLIDPWYFWRFIKEEMQGSSEARKDHLLQQASNMAGDSPSKVVNRLLRINDELTAMKAGKISDASMKKHLLNALDDSAYRTFTEALRCNSKNAVDGTRACVDQFL